MFGELRIYLSKCNKGESRLKLPLKEIQIKNAYNNFINLRSIDHRYASFDYCYNYFNDFEDKSDLASQENLEKSCLHLGFYLASWGMMRASSFLLNRSLRFHIPIIQWLAVECPRVAWTIDVNNYNAENVEELINIYNNISSFIPNQNRKMVLVTKIMLGVFGCTPAFDENFTSTFRKHYGEKTRFRRFNSQSLFVIKEFYNSNENLIEELRNTCKSYDFLTGAETNTKYSRAKIIDMIGFGYQQ